MIAGRAIDLVRPSCEHDGLSHASDGEAALPIYFFNQRFNDEVGVDAVGIDLPDLDAVRERAIELAREVMSDELLEGEVVFDRSIEVTNTTGQVVLVLPFTDVAELRLPRTSSRRRGASTRPSRQRPRRRPKNRRDAP